MNLPLKQLAIKLRQKGRSYNEISQQISVAKSTLSVWLQEVELTPAQTMRLRNKRITHALLGSQKRKTERIDKTKEIIAQSSKEIGKLSRRELFMLGIALYWSEGAKQKEGNISQRVTFSNSDSQMVEIFLLWLDRICHIEIKNLSFELYIHKDADIAGAVRFWKERFRIGKLPIRLKRHKIQTNRKKIGNEYKGLIRVNVRKSTDLNRKISGWIKGIIEYGEWCSGNTSVFGTEDPRSES